MQFWSEMKSHLWFQISCMILDQICTPLSLIAIIYKITIKDSTPILIC